MVTGTPQTPTHVLTGAVLRDVELALLQALPDGQQPGGPLTNAAPSEGQARVTMELPAQVRTAGREAGEIALVDDEMTPIARLVDLIAGPGDLMTGALRRERTRESGEARDIAIGESDIVALRGAQLVVLSRPPVEADEAAVAALAQQSGAVVVLVPDRAEDTLSVPTTTMVALAGNMLRRCGLPADGFVKVAPLAWRDPQSNVRLIAGLATRLQARVGLVLGTSVPSAGDAQWSQAQDALEAGLAESIPGLMAEDETLLRRWRRPRATRGLVMLFTGFSGSGKSTLARGVAAYLRQHTDRTVTLLDGDIVRQMLSSGLGFDRESRILNVRRIGYVGSEIARHGGIAICAPVAPYAATRSEVRAMAEAVGGFILVHVSTPLEECERRDLKGLYAKARRGLIPEFTGISDTYDVPHDADLRVDTSTLAPDAAVMAVVDHLIAGDWIPARHRTQENPS